MTPVQHLLTPQLLLVAVVLITVATIAKVTGTYLGARLIGRRDHWTALAMGGGMNARGAMEIIIATIGLSLGILSQDIFSIVVLDAMVTSLMVTTRPLRGWADAGSAWQTTRTSGPTQARTKRRRFTECDR